MKLKPIILALSLALAIKPCMAATAEQKRESAKKLINVIASAIQKKQINEKSHQNWSSLWGPTLAFWGGIFAATSPKSILKGAGNGFLIGGCFDCLSNQKLSIQYYYGLLGSLLGLLAQECHFYELGVPVGAMAGMILGRVLEDVSGPHARELSDEELEALIARLELALQSETTAPKAAPAA